MFFTFHLNDWKVGKQRRRGSFQHQVPWSLRFYRLALSGESVIGEINERGRLRKLKKFPSMQQLDKCSVLEYSLKSSKLRTPFLDESTVRLSKKITPHLVDPLEVDNAAFEKALTETANSELDSDSQKKFYNFLFDDEDPLAQKFDSIMSELDKGVLSIIPIYCTDELFLLYVSVKHWLHNLGPQHTHPLLTTRVTFTRNFENNNVLKEVFLCCGATFMEYYDLDLFSKLSTELYESSLALITKHLEHSSDPNSQPWILAAYQLLCLRNKSSLNSTVNDCVSCLTNSYQIISSPYYVAKIKSLISNDERPVEELMLEMEQKPKLEPHDRMYLESFIYNYSVSILWAVDISKLPNPYSVYDVLGRALKCFICECDARWMNNPVFGASSEAFEILAKVSYIARLPMPLDSDSIWFKRALQLKKRAHYYTPSVLPQSSVVDEKTQENCMMNLHVGQIVAKTSFLLVSKVINYNDFNILSCQDMVIDVIESMDKIPRSHLIWGILTWSVVVCGVFVTDSGRQKRILTYLDLIRDRFHQLPLFNAKLFLFKTWELPFHERLNILFDRENLTWVNT